MEVRRCYGDRMPSVEQHGVRVAIGVSPDGVVVVSVNVADAEGEVSVSVDRGAAVLRMDVDDVTVFPPATAPVR